MIYLLTAPFGMEDLLAAHLRGRYGWEARRRRNLAGILEIEGSAETAHLLFTEEGIPEVVALTADFDFDGTVEGLLAVCPRSALTLPGTCGPFRVTVQRSGDHVWRSAAAENALGNILSNSSGAPVDLVNFQTEFFCRVVSYYCYLGWRLKRANRPFNRAYVCSAPVPSALAYWLAALAAPAEGHLVYDPFCRDGALLSAVAGHCPKLRLAAADPLKANSIGTLTNLCGLGTEARIFESENGGFAKNIGADRLITAFHYSSLNQRHRPKQFFREFFLNAAQALKKGGKMVLLSLYGSELVEAGKAAGCYLVEERITECWGRIAYVTVWER